MLAERLVVIRNMEIGGAAQCLWVLCSAAVVEFGSVWWIIWTEFIVPSTRTKNQKTNGSMVMLILDQVFVDFKYKKKILQAYVNRKADQQNMRTPFNMQF